MCNRCQRYYEGNQNCTYRTCGCGNYNQDLNPLYEAEILAQEAYENQCRENRCARQFVHCMKNTTSNCHCNRCYNWKE